ncbi:hypothetical protein D0Y65_049166 [Glycine soja]|uniref:Retrotransposon gag domain-containing protein n=1 Tax=Glycine soja TaxID=3848 RepID=A0A445FVN6_GLYSO|nr:hypothetical protein D0Y65_049166 [Glycine soja]
MAPTKANKEVDEALQAITAQLEVLQTQLENKQQLQDSRRLHLQQSMDSRQEALQTFLANLKEQLTVQQPSPPPFMLASFYMKCDALSWFKWMSRNCQFSDWPSFTCFLELCFGQSSYTNHRAELFKLRQTCSVFDYPTSFEKLCNRVIGLKPESTLNCFISGLQPEIRHELAVFHPSSISHAISLAKLIEDKLKDNHSKPYRSTNFHSSTASRETPHVTITQPLSTIPIKSVPSTYIQECWAQGLCYYCDEKFVAGFKCDNGRFLLLIEDNEDILIHSYNISFTFVAEEASEPFHLQLSSHALLGQPSPKSLKFQGCIGGLAVMAKEEKVQVTDDSLSEADLLSEWHLLSEAYSSLSGLENP